MIVFRSEKSFFLLIYPHKLTALGEAKIVAYGASREASLVKAENGWRMGRTKKLLWNGRTEHRLHARAGNVH